MWTRQLRWLLCLPLVLSAGVALAQSTMDGLPQSVRAEIKSVDGLPNGRYVEVKNWAMGQLYPGIGRVSDDPDATGGKARDAVVDKDGGSGFLFFGPYDQLEPGNYVAFFRAKMLEEPGDEAVATVDVTANKGRAILGTRSVSASDLTTGKYVQIPVSFRFSGTDLECRLSWSGTTSLRADKVTVYRFDGDNFPYSIIPMVAQPMSPGTVRNLPYRTEPRPYKDIFPRAPKPASKLLVCDLTKAAPDWVFLTTTLQGIVNREHPSVYCLIVPTDQLWLEWDKRPGWVTETEAVTPRDLLSRFGKSIKGMVITDPNLPATKNIATMIAGVEDAVVASPRLAKTLSLPVVADLRGRWTKSVDAYRWAFANLWLKMNHHTAACMWPNAAGTRDYLVQNRIFVFWLPGRIDGARPYANADAEMRFGEELLAALPANSPIMGYPWTAQDVGMGELPGVGLMAEYGKYLVGSVDAPNMSVHSGFTVAGFHQRTRPTPELQDGKVYIAYTMSDGDNIPVLTATNWPQLWNQPERGQFPIGWTISPASSVLIPDVMDYYYTTAGPNDSFLAAVSGVGYTYPNVYGKRYRAADRGRVFDGFLGLTDEYMKRMDLHIVCPTGAGLDEIRRYADRIPSLDAIFADYGKAVDNYEDATHVTARNVPVFHAVGSWDPNGLGEKQINDMVNQIKTIVPPKSRPAFLHVFLCNWFWDLPALKDVLKRLGPEYVIVSPDELSAMYRQWVSKKQLMTHLSPYTAGIEGYRLNSQFRAQNVTPKPMNVVLKAASGLANAQLTPNRATLKPGQEIVAKVTGMVTGSKVTMEARGPFGVKQSVMQVRAVPASEILGDLPKDVRLRFVNEFGVDSLGHLTGDRVVGKDGSVTWEAIKGKSKPAHIMYGPYAQLAAGRYLVLYRMKRTGEGAGNAALLDTCVVGAQTSTKTRMLRADELPLGRYKSVAMIFNHPGGSYESRVLWLGNASLAVERVTVWEILK